MKRKALLGPAMALTALVGGAFLFSSPAAAQGTPKVVQYAWWVIADYDPTATVPYDNAPDAPDLHIGYGPNPDGAEKQDPTSPVNGPTEVSAVQYQLADPLPEGTESTLPVGLLKLAVDTTYTPKVSPDASLLACPSLDPWQAVDGGNWQARVTYDASAGCAAGVLDPSTNTFTFTITAGMVEGLQTVDLAIVPGFIPVGLGNVPPSGTPQSPWSVELKKPAGSDLTPEAVSDSSIPNGFALPSEGSSVPTSLATGGLPPTSVIGGAPALGGQPPASPAQKPGYTVPTTLAGGTARVALTSGRLIAALLLLLLLIGGLLLMSLDVQRLLTPAGQSGGLGRFARQRSTPPLPI